jgi:hypothetical protein
MPADPIHPDQLAGEVWSRAGLVPDPTACRCMSWPTCPAAARSRCRSWS